MSALRRLQQQDQSGCILTYFINAFKEIIESTWKSIWIVIMHKRALSQYIKSPNLSSPTSEREAFSFYFANFHPTKVVGRGPRTLREIWRCCVSQFHLRPTPPPSPGLLRGIWPPCQSGGGAFADVPLPGSRSFASPRTIPQLLTRTRFPIRI